MRLGYLVPQFPTQTHAFFWREAQALREAGVHVRLISTRRPAETCPHAFATEAVGQTAYLTPPSVRGLASAVSAAGRVACYMRSLDETPLRQRAVAAATLAPAAAELAALCRRENLDHVHVHSCGNAAHVVALAERISGVPYSLTLHGDLSVYGHDHGSKMSRATLVSVVTRALQKQVHDAVGFPHDRIPVVTMGVDLECFQPAPAPPAAGPFGFLTVARLHPSKGHRFALEALRQVPDARYTVVGQGSEQAGLETLVKTLGLTDRVGFTGPLGEAGIRDQIHCADAFLLPSVGLGEAAPVSVMEAMACGKPVVSSIIGGTPDMIDDGVEGYLVPQGDVPALATTMRRLAADPSDARCKGDAARRRAGRQFDHRQNAARLLDGIRRHAAAAT